MNPGDKLGAWEAVRYVGRTKRGQRWVFRCGCGVEEEHLVGALTWKVSRGASVRCVACAAKRKKGDSLYRTYGRCVQDVLKALGHCAVQLSQALNPAPREEPLRGRSNRE